MSARTGTRPQKISKLTEACPASGEAPTARKLAAILSADIKGYSRLMGEDEEGTLLTLTTYREVIANVIAHHRGRVVNCIGDNILAEFASAVDAVRGARAIQETLNARNAPLSAARRMELRIGINVGDVLVQDNQLYGDGVNVAARMEAAADAGGICITGTVYDQVHNKVPLHYEHVGEQQLKNIVHPVRVYRVRMDAKAQSQISIDQPELLLHFPPFHLDVSNGYLWRGKKRIPLMPKDFAVLHTLVTHANHVVTHLELFASVWPDTIVSHGVLKVCLRRIRHALNDTTNTPRFIETVHRRGYRFLPPVATQPVESFTFKVQSRNSVLPPSPQSPAPFLVGRDAEIAHLHTWLGKALNGERQIGFVTGEPGIGKTTLVETFLFGVRSLKKFGVQDAKSRTPNPELSSTPNLWLGRGQCIEHYGPGEPYLPILDALGRLCRAPGGEQLVTLFKRYAPTWLVQMPALLDATELDTLQHKISGATRERMLRELAEALEAITSELPLVLVLEDLHWSDFSTLDLLAFIARRQEAARLLIVGTYRPVEMLTEQHPLKRLSDELYAHQLAHELRVTPLNESAVGNYLTQRFPQSVFPTRLAAVLYQRTGGNPLFLSTMVQELVQREVLTQANGGTWSMQADLMELDAWVPESVHHVLARQRERLGADEQRVLEAASVAGLEFSAATVAAALEMEVMTVEEQCGRLAERQQFLRLAGISEWPDGTRASRYAFQHALYQEFWHERVSVGHQQQWHLRMGARKEAAWGTRYREIAVELALHFEQGHDYQRAVLYLQKAGENAVRRWAHQEAISLLTRERELLHALPDTRARSQQELQLCTLLGPTLMALKGYSALEVEKTYTRALELCEQVGETPRRYSVLLGLAFFYLARGQLQAARQCGEQCFSLAQQGEKPLRLLQAHVVLANVFFYQGEFTQAEEHLRAGIALYHAVQSQLPPHTLHDPGINALLSLHGWTLWCLGQPDRAVRCAEEAVAVAERSNHPLSQAIAAVFASGVWKLCRDERAMLQYAEHSVSLATAQGFTLWTAYGKIMRGWAVGQLVDANAGIAQIQQGLSITRSIGAEAVHSWFLLMLAETSDKAGQIADGLATIVEALEIVQQRGERAFAAELYRLKGEFLLAQKSKSQKAKDKSQRGARGWRREASSSSPQAPSLQPPVSEEALSEAEGYFLKAIEIARTQSAKSWELRATMSLARLWRQQGKRHEAHQMLSDVYNWFTEGFETKDLQEAKGLIEELRH